MIYQILLHLDLAEGRKMTGVHSKRGAGPHFTDCDRFPPEIFDLDLDPVMVGNEGKGCYAVDALRATRKVNR